MRKIWSPYQIKYPSHESLFQIVASFHAFQSFTQVDKANKTGQLAMVFGAMDEWIHFSSKFDVKSHQMFALFCHTCLGTST